MWNLWTWIWQIINLKSLPENWKEQMQLIQQFGLTCGGQQFKAYAPEEEGLRWFKADAVDILSLELIRLWASKNHTFHVYPHMMCGHLGNEFRILGIDHTDAQLQGFENGHQNLKKAPSNNAKPGPIRTTQVATAARTGNGVKSPVRTHGKKVGTW